MQVYWYPCFGFGMIFIHDQIFRGLHSLSFFWVLHLLHCTTVHPTGCLLIFECSHTNNKKAFQSKANCLLSSRSRWSGVPVWSWERAKDKGSGWGVPVWWGKGKQNQGVPCDLWLTNGITESNPLLTTERQTRLKTLSYRNFICER